MTAYVIITLIFKYRLAPAGERRISFAHMRLSEKEQLKIVQAVRVADPEAKIWLFGSRVHDDRKGGDIDIAILSQTIRRSERAQIRRAITDCIGEQQIDIVVSDTGAEPFFRHATEQGVRLN